MKTQTNRLSRWAVIRFMSIGAIGMATVIVPSNAVQHRERVEPEIKAGGLTVAEQRANQLQLNEKLTALLPPGFDRTPLRVEITKSDRNNLLTQPPNGTAPLRIGVVKSLVNPVGKPVGKALNYGVIKNNPDGSFVWAMTVISPGAQAIRLHITDFSLPNNTEMYFMNDIGQADGPYTGVGRNGDGAFWTHSVASESGQLVVRYTGNTPETDLPRMSFVVSEVALILGRPPQAQEQSGTWPCSDNALCLEDASCIYSGPAYPAKGAVAKMEWIKGPYIYTCTGGLLADTDPNSQIPYFLTANHCLSSSNSNLETFFDYTTDSCKGTCPNNILTGGEQPVASTIGATVVATGRKGDFTLMTLNQSPPADSTFLGWDRTPIASSNGALLYRISNANFGPQVYSEHEVDVNSPTCTRWPRGERIYSTDVVGATMGGSSGSPVLNGAGEVVGQLSGCCGYDCSNVCDSANNWTVDGALAYYWNSVAGFLDPQGGCTSDAQCDDGLFCTGIETCVSGSCQSSGDPCPAGQVCDESSNSCSTAACLGNKASCNSNNDCCSGNCKNNTCRGN